MQCDKKHFPFGAKSTPSFQELAADASADRLPPISDPFRSPRSVSSVVLDTVDEGVISELDGMLENEYCRFRESMTSELRLSCSSPSQLLREARAACASPNTRAALSSGLRKGETPPHRLPGINGKGPEWHPAADLGVPSKPAWETRQPLHSSEPHPAPVAPISPVSPPPPSKTLPPVVARGSFGRALPSETAGGFRAIDSSGQKPLQSEAPQATQATFMAATMDAAKEGRSHPWDGLPRSGSSSRAPAAAATAATSTAPASALPRHMSSQYVKYLKENQAPSPGNAASPTPAPIQEAPSFPSTAYYSYLKEAQFPSPGAGVQAPLQTSASEPVSFPSSAYYDYLKDKTPSTGAPPPVVPSSAWAAAAPGPVAPPAVVPKASPAAAAAATRPAAAQPPSAQELTNLNRLLGLCNPMPFNNLDALRQSIAVSGASTEHFPQLRRLLEISATSSPHGGLTAVGSLLGRSAEAFSSAGPLVQCSASVQERFPLLVTLSKSVGEQQSQDFANLRAVLKLGDSSLAGLGKLTACVGTKGGLSELDSLFAAALVVAQTTEDKKGASSSNSTPAFPALAQLFGVCPVSAPPQGFLPLGLPTLWRHLT
eukprot:RCo050932